MKHGRKVVQSNRQEFWRQHVRAWEQSGLSQKAYCEGNALSLSVFGYWKRKFGLKEKAAPQFYPLTIPEPTASEKTASAELHVHLQNGRFRVGVEAGFSPELLRNVILALEQL